MSGYIIRRLLFMIPTIIIVTLVVFFITRLIPGDVVELMAAQNVGDVDVDVEQIKERLGLDRPVHIQYGEWVVGIITSGDLGVSLWKQTPVTEELFRRFPVSFELGLVAIIVGLIIALPIGMYSALRQDTVGDYLGRSVAIAFIALPTFWIGTMVVVFPSIWWGWSPSMSLIGFTEDPMGNLAQFIIPATILGMFLSGSTMRMVRTMMLEILRQDYIRTAWSKGLKEKVIVSRHALKNAMIPVITVIGLQLPVLIGGSVILEQIFCLPGIGRLLVEVINNRDYTMLSGLNLFMAGFVLVANLGVDITYGILNPKIRY